MRIVYRARNTDDARSACDVLTAAGITSHVPDADRARPAVPGQVEVVSVLVDNRCLGPARRALQLWIGQNALRAARSEK